MECNLGPSAKQTFQTNNGVNQAVLGVISVDCGTSEPFGCSLNQRNIDNFNQRDQLRDPLTVVFACQVMASEGPAGVRPPISNPSYWVDGHGLLNYAPL